MRRPEPDSNRRARLCRPLPNHSAIGPLLEPEHGFRLASLADGEGCFWINCQKRQGRRDQYVCGFTVKMRADDAPFLDRWQEITGVGRVYRVKAYADPRRRNKPSVMWVVVRKLDCLWLADVFEQYPLWSKKARDFAVWAEAVRYGFERVAGDDDGERFAGFRLRLTEAREYVL